MRRSPRKTDTDVLPINGFATGLLLGAAVSPRTTRRRVIFYMVLGCAALLVVELALLGSLSGFAGNLGRSR